MVWMIFVGFFYDYIGHIVFLPQFLVSLISYRTYSLQINDMEHIEHIDFWEESEVLIQTN